MKTKDLGATALDVENNLISRYPGRAKFLLTHIDMMEKTRRFKKVVVHAADLKKLWTDFKDLFKIIKAGGGLVCAPDQRILAIHRLGYWDLPKGKIEKGEGKKKAALREVMEETGVAELELKEKLLTTYHVYKDTRYGRVLKKTYWYRMEGPAVALTPQAEEGIEKAIWMAPDELLAQSPIYRNIIDVVSAYVDK